MELFFLAFIGFLVLLFATIQDVRTTFVSDWLTAATVFFALLFRFVAVLFGDLPFSFFTSGLFWWGVFVLLGYALYYAHFFAGGDAKLFMALGPLLPFSFPPLLALPSLGLFLGVFFFSGAVYGLFMSFVLAFRYSEGFLRSFRSLLPRYRNFLLLGVFAFLLFSLGGVFASLPFWYGGLFFLLLPLLFLFAHAVERGCMIRTIPSSQLLEGDWLYKDVLVGKRRILSSWEGLSVQDIAFLRRHKKQVTIRQGIPFVPAFLFAYLLYYTLFFLGFSLG